MENINVKLYPKAFIPVRAHQLDAGLDLRTPYEFTIPSGGSYQIDTGVHVAIPAGYYGKLESKSGLNVNHGVVSLGGVIDAGYTGSIVAKLYNFGEYDYHFNAGDKIVQLIIMQCETPEVVVTFDAFVATERGDNGFGSSGK